MEFERPTRENVELGDFLVAQQRRRTRLLEIQRLDSGGISAGDSGDMGLGITKAYSQSVIIKKDGSYLVGADVIIHGESYK